MAAIATTIEQPDAAGRLIGAADALDARTGSALWPADQVLGNWCLARLEENLDPAAFSALRHAGGALTGEQAVAEARLVAAAILGEERMTTIWQETGAPVPSLGRDALPSAPPADKAGPGFSADHDGLTRREREVLDLIRQRMSDVEIAARLGISPDTVKIHVADLFAKLGVANRRNAVAAARLSDETSIDAGIRAIPAGSSDGVERAGLTPRELDVLHQLVNGRTDREIAANLFISRRTASKHVEAILAKLGVRSRGAAVAAATRQGLVLRSFTGQDL
jgi:DNA-binding CsgD family transcriptional regulator